MLLELKDICFTRDNRKILDHINLDIDVEKFVAITGPNGSGKSTLVKIIMGIEKPDSGRVVFDGKDITDMPINERAKLGMSFAFQQPVKFKGITVYDLLKIAAKKEINKHIDNKVRAIKLEIGDRFHIEEDDDLTLFNAQTYLILKHYPNDYFNYEIIGFKAAV